MSSLSFPDINVWLALASPEHSGHLRARSWWDAETGLIAFCRFTQMGLIRLVSTAAAMGGKPLSLDEAWQVYDSFGTDERVAFLSEPDGVDGLFRSLSTGPLASPKVLGDAWLMAVAQRHGGNLVTFDRALVERPGVLVLTGTAA